MDDARTAVFRADASADIGGGHVVRCLTLAEAMVEAGWRCGFAVREGTLETVPALGRSGHEVQMLAQDPGSEPSEMAGRWGGDVDWLVVDHYRRDAAFESACRPWARRIMAIDDLADRAHDCDLLLDQTLGREAADYAAHVPEACRLLLGPAYALVRPGFAPLRDSALARRATRGRIERILVSCGASDPHNATAVVLEGIARSGIEAQVDAVLGAGARHLAAVRRQIAQLPQTVRLHVDTPDMANLMLGADLAIGAGGTTSWERCCLGLPALIVITGPDQYRVAEALALAGCATVLGEVAELSADIVAESLARELSGKGLHAEAWRRASQICDGLGTSRALLSLLPDGRSRDGDSVRLRLAREDDEQGLLSWQQQPGVRRYARDPRPPTAHEHHQWLQQRLSSSHCRLMIVECGGDAAGMLRLDLIEDAARRDSYEVSILIAPEQQGRGLALAALGLVRVWLPDAELVAETLPGNVASQRLFEAAGYVPGEDGLLHSPPEGGRDDRVTARVRQVS